MADTIHGDDATLSTLFRRVLGFPTPRAVKMPDFLMKLGQTIPGEGAEQKRMGENRFLRDVGAPEAHKRSNTLTGAPPPPPPQRETQADRDRKDANRVLQLRQSVDSAKGLSPEQKMRGQQLLDTQSMNALRDLIFPNGSPGVTL